MSKEQLEELKNDLREELKKEFKEELEKQKKFNIWEKYTNEVINPILDEKLQDKPKESYTLRCALNSIARVSLNKRHVCKITEEDLKEIKPLIEYILNNIQIREEIK